MMDWRRHNLLEFSDSFNVYSTTDERQFSDEFNCAENLHHTLFPHQLMDNY
jgi:hypothetical protein